MPLTAADALPLQKETTEKRRYMPLSKYFKGKGKQVMKSMEKSNAGDKDAAQREFYATANSKPAMKPAKRKSIGDRIAERS